MQWARSGIHSGVVPDRASISGVSLGSGELFMSFPPLVPVSPPHEP